MTLPDPTGPSGATDPSGSTRATGASAAGRSVTEVFTAERPRLVGLAYRITGSRVDAEDLVQEAWLRAQRVDWSTVERPEAWLTTTVSRLALDDLRSARRRRESYVGPWLPEPVQTSDRSAADRSGLRSRAGGGQVGGHRVGVGGGAGSAGAAAGGDPADAVELAESLTFGFLRLLDTLNPIERVVLLLADVFDVPYRQVAAVVDRSPDACRQIASRARRRVREGRRRPDPPEDAVQVAAQLLAAVAAGDVDRTVSLLAEDVVLVSDGGAHARAARRPVLGPDRVARFLINVSRRDLPGLQVDQEMTTINGEPALLVWQDGRPFLTVSAGVSGGRVRTVHIVNNPDKLAALDITSPMT